MPPCCPAGRKPPFVRLSSDCPAAYSSVRAADDAAQIRWGKVRSADGTRLAHTLVMHRPGLLSVGILTLQFAFGCADSGPDGSPLFPGGGGTTSAGGSRPINTAGQPPTSAGTAGSLAQPAAAGGGAGGVIGSGTPGRAGGSEAARRPFVVLNGTNFLNPPDDLDARGFHPLNMFYESGVEWVDGVRDWPMEGSVKKVATGTSTSAFDQLAEFDFESDPYWGSVFAPDDATRRRTAHKLLTIAGWIRAANPEVKFGFYNFTPQQSVFETNDPARLEQWRQMHFDVFQPVADAVDHLSPQLYTFFPDGMMEDFWNKDAHEVIRLAKEMGKGKPVYPYVWMLVHGGADPKYWELDLPPAQFKRELQKIRDEGADGVIIWGAWKHGEQLAWDESAPWWVATQKFIQETAR